MIKYSDSDASSRTNSTAFGIENFGYAGEVVFPLRITLKDPGAPVTLSAQVKLLVCSNVCVPEEFDLSLRLGRGNVIDSTSAGLIGSVWCLLATCGKVSMPFLSSICLDSLPL